MSAKPAFAELLEQVSRVMASGGWRWYVFGAQAVQVFGVPRATADVDITIEVADDALDGPARRLRRLAARCVRSSLPSLQRHPESAGLTTRTSDLAGYRTVSRLTAQCRCLGRPPHADYLPKEIETFTHGGTS